MQEQPCHPDALNKRLLSFFMSPGHGDWWAKEGTGVKKVSEWTAEEEYCPVVPFPPEKFNKTVHAPSLVWGWQASLRDLPGKT